MTTFLTILPAALPWLGLFVAWVVVAFCKET